LSSLIWLRGSQAGQSDYLHGEGHGRSLGLFSKSAAEESRRREIGSDDF